MHVRLTRRPQNLAAVAAFLIGWFVVLTAFADGGPEPPVSPKSVKECESWKDNYYSYLQQEKISCLHCGQANDSITPVKDWVPTNICAAIKIDIPPVCAQMCSEWHCDSSKF